MTICVRRRGGRRRRLFFSTKSLCSKFIASSGSAFQDEKCPLFRTQIRIWVRARHKWRFVSAAKGTSRPRRPALLENAIWDRIGPGARTNCPIWHARAPPTLDPGPQSSVMVQPSLSLHERRERTTALLVSASTTNSSTEVLTSRSVRLEHPERFTTSKPSPFPR